MFLTMQSQFSGKYNTMELDIEQEEYDAWLKGVGCVQKAFPRLSNDEREFILSGAWGTEFDDAFEEQRNECL